MEQPSSIQLFPHGTFMVRLGRWVGIKRVRDTPIREHEFMERTNFAQRDEHQKQRLTPTDSERYVDASGTYPDQPRHFCGGTQRRGGLG